MEFQWKMWKFLIYFSRDRFLNQFQIPENETEALRLIEAGADANIKRFDGQTLMHLAALAGNRFKTNDSEDIVNDFQ